MRFIAFMALGDIFGNIPYLYTWDYSPTSGWCYVGGILLQTGSVSAWLWTSALCFLWHRASKRTLKGLTWHIMPMFHIICWGLPLIFALSSIALSPFENSTTYDGVCSTYGTYEARLFHNVWAYVLLVLCLIFMGILYADLVRFDHEKGRQSEVSVVHTRNVAAAKSTLVFYPILFVVFWLPKLILTTFYELLNENNSNFVKTIDVFTCWYMFHGVAVAAVFFYNSPMARSLWYVRIKSFLKSCGWIQKVEEDEQDEAIATPRISNTEYGFEDDFGDADSLVDYRSTYADPIDTDVNNSSFRERRSSLHRVIGMVPSSVRSSMTFNTNMNINNSSLSTKPTITTSSSMSSANTAPTSYPPTIYDESNNQHTITKQHLEECNNLPSVANPIMSQWLKNDENLA